ncbi:MAG: glycoside hydrolase, family 57 [Ignavibacteria bacterium]|nr:glycoside hydrolase, family 57 [Ignavibacteria bacterium]
MKPLKVAILWHFHQPYYKKGNEFILPWARFHGVKDYLDLPLLSHEFPALKHTINIVPSLQMQLDAYINGTVEDKVQRLTRIPAAQLGDEDKKIIKKEFFYCNTENMILPYQRYRELFEVVTKSGEEMPNFATQDWLDLQVWYNLTWFGILSRNNPAIKRLFDKGKNFTEAEKYSTLELHKQVLSQISSQLKILKSLDQVEISCSPMYHPILPLLCDTSSHLEAMPGAALPNPGFMYPEDAEQHIKNSIDFIKKSFDVTPNGFWPSEGSISDEVLNLFIKNGIRWAATDEEILQASTKETYHFTDKYFPHKYSSKSGDVILFFRDHTLSDAIGFVYSRWQPFDAAADFCTRLRSIRTQLIEKYGEDCLEHAVVPVILDGENCWEYYNKDGMEFRRQLFRMLTETEDLKTVTYSEAAQEQHTGFLNTLTHIRAGSWINANFDIWIGHQDDLAAWSMLAKARSAVELAKPELNPESLAKVMEAIYIAEGSDWCWWYGDDHTADNKDDFDVLFRWHIAEVYRIIGLEVPEDVNVPIGQAGHKEAIEPQKEKINPPVTGKISDEYHWSNAGLIDTAASMSAMHQIGGIIQNLSFGSSGDKLFFRCRAVSPLTGEDTIEIKFISPVEFSVIFDGNSVTFNSHGKTPSHIQFATGEAFDFAFSQGSMFNGISKSKSGYELELVIRTQSNAGEIYYPRQGSYILQII